MKVLSGLFFGCLLIVLSTPTLTFGQDKRFLVSSTNNDKVFLDQIVINQSGFTKKRHGTIPSAEFGTSDPWATALTESNSEDAINVLIGLSDDSNGSIQRSCSLGGAILRDRVWVFGKTKSVDLSWNQPGSWSAFSATDSQEGSLITKDIAGAALDRLFVAGKQQTTQANDYLSFALNAESIPTGAKSTIFSNPNTKFALGGTISRDGGVGVQLSATSALWQLSTRLLNNGLPRKAPSSWTVPAYTGYSPDITNTIEVNSGVAGAPALKIRYLVYRAFHGVGTAAQQSQIMIQKIDDATGKPLEAAKPLTVFKNAFQAPAEAFQALAIAPNGDLLVFTEYSGACKKMILKAVKLVNGSVSGTAKLIAGCAGLAQSPVGYLGLDIMEEPGSESP